MNKQIATLFKEAGIIEKYGSGIKRIMESVRTYGRQMPLFEEIDLLRENPKMTREEIALLLGKSQNTIKEHLTRLKSEGWVDRVGSDRDGYWKVRERSRS
jgi:ATP-dependent DNA helicase RecG